MRKAVTLLGMSGAGKTHFSQRMAEWGWAHYSIDHEIAKRLGVEVSVDDLSALSAFIGQIGDESKGGLPLDEFKRRQGLYMDAEMDALRDMPVDDVEGVRVVNDSTGSFCEVEDEAVIAAVAEKSLLVYIETDAKSHEAVIQRAVEYPKPLYFPPAKFDNWVADFCGLRGVRVAEIEPNDFSAWVFPRLFSSRLPKYERLAADYGVKVSATDVHECADETAFLELIGER